MIKRISEGIIIGMLALNNGCSNSETIYTHPSEFLYGNLENKVEANMVVPMLFDTPSRTEKGFLSYGDPISGIRIDYPSDWTKVPKHMGTIVYFTSPVENNQDRFRENLNVIVQDLSNNPMSLKEYTTLSLDQIKKQIMNSDILESRSTAIDNNPAHMVVYTGKQGEFNLKWMGVWTVKKDKAYVVTYTAEINKYSKFLDIAQRMIRSLKIFY